MEGVEAQCRQDFECADVTGLIGLFGFNHVPNLFTDSSEFFIGQRRAEDTNALAELVQMGTGEQAGAESGGAQNRLEDGCGRTLALASGDVNRGPTLLRVAQATQNRTDSVEREIALLATRP